MRPKCAALVVAVTAVSMLLGCSDEPEARTARASWAETAEDWLGNVQRAGREGTPNVEEFLAPGVVLDLRGSGGGLAWGTSESLGLIGRLQYDQPGLRLVGPPYLSPNGMLVPAVWEERSLFAVHDAVLVLTLSPEGLVGGEGASSVVSGQTFVEPDRDWASLLRIGEEYVDRSMSAGQTTTVAAIPGHGGPAVYGVPRHGVDDGFERVALLLRSEDEAGCPGRTAVVLTLASDGSIAAEERYHRVDDARRCLDDGDLFEGWWTTMVVPPPVGHERTGTVRSHGAVVEIWNGTPALESLVEWGLDRFAAAGLEVPRPRSVTFYPAADRCRGNLAVAGGEANDEILACFGEGLACPTSPCPPWSAKAQHTMLHELAHTWMTEHLDDEQREAYEDLVGLAWADDDEPGERWALERAAEVIVWGLEDPPQPLGELEGIDSEPAEEFGLLTGRVPVSLRRH